MLNVSPIQALSGMFEPSYFRNGKIVGDYNKVYVSDMQEIL